VSIVVRNDTGVAGFVLPGDRVDVNEFVPLKIEGSTPEDARISANVIAKPVLRYVTVLAVDQTFAHDLEGARPSNTVTLEVTPEDALLLGAASQRAALGLALIGRKEERAETVQTPAPQPAPRAQTRAPARPARTTTTVRVINGSNDASVTTPIAPPPAPAGPVQLVGGEG
jgi:pilus assembly protein CpaB